MQTHGQAYTSGLFPCVNREDTQTQTHTLQRSSSISAVSNKIKPRPSVGTQPNLQYISHP